MGGALKDSLLRARAPRDPSAETGEDDEEAEDIPAYLLEFLQSHRNHQHLELEDDFILGYHDDYRERYDGFDQPPPFRQRHKPRDSSEARARGRARGRASDLEISEEEAFSTRVFVTTPRRQR